MLALGEVIDDNSPEFKLLNVQESDGAMFLYREVPLPRDEEQESIQVQKYQFRVAYGIDKISNIQTLSQAELLELHNSYIQGLSESFIASLRRIEERYDSAGLVMIPENDFNSVEKRIRSFNEIVLAAKAMLADEHKIHRMLLPLKLSTLEKETIFPNLITKRHELVLTRSENPVYVKGDAGHLYLSLDLYGYFKSDFKLKYFHWFLEAFSGVEVKQEPSYTYRQDNIIDVDF